MIDFSEDIVEYKEAETDSNLWVNKYRPRKLTDICLDSGLKQMFEAQIQSGDIKNVCLIGPPGTGKTTLALALVNEIHAEPLFVPCASGDGRIDTITAKIIPFCQCSSSARKVVILDELDSASANQANSFQKALRNVIECYPDCRFIATANIAENIIPAVLSRMPAITLAFNLQQLMERVIFIFKQESIDLTTIQPDVLKSCLAKIIRHSYPDIRAIFGKLQIASLGGLTEEKLTSLISSDSSDEKYNAFYDTIVKIIQNASTPNMIRSLVNQAIAKELSSDNSGLDKIASAYEFSKGLFNYILDKSLISTIDDIITLTQQLNTIELCIDKEPQVFRFILLILKAIKQ